ncbi:MAG: type II secretion system protein [Candidatus Entotheonellia bacterium]
MGFTLIELLVVIVVIATLATLVAPNVFKHVGAAKDATARSQIEMLASALDAYRLKTIFGGEIPRPVPRPGKRRTSTGDNRTSDLYRRPYRCTEGRGVLRHDRLVSDACSSGCRSSSTTPTISMRSLVVGRQGLTRSGGFMKFLKRQGSTEDQKGEWTAYMDYVESRKGSLPVQSGCCQAPRRCANGERGTTPARIQGESIPRV